MAVVRRRAADDAIQVGGAAQRRSACGARGARGAHGAVGASGVPGGACRGAPSGGIALRHRRAQEQNRQARRV